MSVPLHSESASVPALRVVLVEDSAMLRGMLCEMLAELDGVGVVAEAEDEQGALAALEHRERLLEDGARRIRAAPVVVARALAEAGMAIGGGEVDRLADGACRVIDMRAVHLDGIVVHEKTPLLWYANGSFYIRCVLLNHGSGASARCSEEKATASPRAAAEPS